MAKTKKHWNKMTDSKARQPGQQRRFRGRMVLPGGSPRAHTHGGHSQAADGFARWDAPAQKGKAPGKFKVSPPTKRWQRRGIVRNATTGEII